MRKAEQSNQREVLRKQRPCEQELVKKAQVRHARSEKTLRESKSVVTTVV